jgi:phosphohistidine phosphatase
MARLILLRHAKSVAADEAADDRERPLAPRGRKDAEAMGRAMRARGITPELVLCSPARRARQTWELVSAAWNDVPPMQIVEALYDFGDGSGLMQAIAARGGGVAALMLVGHNPSMENLARRLTAEDGSRLRRTMLEKFPTAACAIIDVASGWTELRDGSGRLAGFIRPRDLPGRHED